jgi:ribosomal protein S13
MARRKLNRIQIHKKICEKVGMTTKSHIGYLSRSEMLDVLQYLGAVELLLNDLEQKKSSTVNHTDGQGHNAKITGN